MSTMTDRENVVRAATDLNSDPAVAFAWYSNDALSVFDGKTPAQLVAEGRAADVLRYIETLGAGFCG
jgi:hypothetical protein